MEQNVKFRGAHDRGGIGGAENLHPTDYAYREAIADDTGCQLNR
jgi:hypothetical protein